MTTKQKIKKELDSLPESVLNKIYEYLHLLKHGKKKQTGLKKLHLKGQFDNINIRRAAYE